MTKAQEKLKDFLEKHPHLIPFQRKLEEEMRKVPSEYRLLVFARFLIDNLDELQTELGLLKYKVEEHAKI